MSAYRTAEGYVIDAEIFTGTGPSHDRITRWMAKAENGTDTIDPKATAYRGMNLRNAKTLPEDSGPGENVEFCFVRIDGTLCALQKGQAIFRPSLEEPVFDWLVAEETQGWTEIGEVVG